MAASRWVEGRGWFCCSLFLSFPIRSWSSRGGGGNWTDGEERMTDRIKATLPDAELALWATRGFVVEGTWWGGEKVREQVHQQCMWVNVCVCVCVFVRKQSKLHRAQRAPHQQKGAFHVNKCMLHNMNPKVKKANWFRIKRPVLKRRTMSYGGKISSRAVYWTEHNSSWGFSFFFKKSHNLCRFHLRSLHSLFQHRSIFFKVV